MRKTEGDHVERYASHRNRSQKEGSALLLRWTDGVNFLKMMLKRVDSESCVILLTAEVCHCEFHERPPFTGPYSNIAGKLLSKSGKYSVGHCCLLTNERKQHVLKPGIRVRLRYC